MARARKSRVGARHLPDAFASLFERPFDESSDDLWWVRPPMVRVAVQAAQDIEAEMYDDFTVLQHRPARFGLMVWEQGCGLSAPRVLGDPEWPIIGAIWGLDQSVSVSVVPISERDGGLAPTPIPRGMEAADSNVMRTTARLEKLLVTSWILADQPTLGRKSFLTRTGADTVQYDWRTLQPKPELPRSITVSTLREIARRTEKWDQADAEGEGKWQLTKRHTVRGHWRNQAVGSGHKLRKPTYVPPYVKGPDGAPLVDQAPLVHVWRR